MAARVPRVPRGQRNKQPLPVPTKEEEEEEYLRRRRTDFMDDVSEETDYVRTFYENQKNPKGAVGAVYRSEILRYCYFLFFLFLEEKDSMT